MPERPRNCLTAKIARTVSEMHALPPKLAEKKCIYRVRQVFENKWWYGTKVSILYDNINALE